LITHINIIVARPSIRTFISGNKARKTIKSEDEKDQKIIAYTQCSNWSLRFFYSNHEPYDQNVFV